jgi:hypothetical protein
MWFRDFNKWVKDIEAIPHSASGKAAENVVEASLEKEGLEKIDIKNMLKYSGYKTKTEMVEALYTEEFWPTQTLYEEESWRDYPLTGYIAQPLGSQKSPDFIVLTNDRTYFIEVKGAKTPSGYQFNSHLIKDDYIYVLSDPSVGFRVVEGFCLMTDEIRQLLKECHKECQAVQKKYNEKILAHSSNAEGWSYYARSMYQQRNVYA